MAGRDDYYGGGRGGGGGGYGGAGGGGYGGGPATFSMMRSRAPMGDAVNHRISEPNHRISDAIRYDSYDGYGGGGGGFGGPGRQGGFGGGPPGGGFGGGFGGPGGGFGGPGGFDAAQSPLDAEIQVVIREIHNELGMFDASGEYGEQFKNARRLLAAESDKLENNIDPEWLEVDIPKPIKVTKKVLIPNFRHPRFNFVGKILGPKGASLQAMAKTYKCHIYVLGRGSTKDRNKEQELLSSGDPQYAHYGGPLHVKVETIAPAHIAYKRVAGVLEELNRILQPVREDTTPGHLKEGENGNGDAADGGDGNGKDAGNDGESDKQQNSFGGGGGRGGFGDRGRGGRGAGGGGMRGGFRGRGGPGGGRPRGFRPY